ncbi:acyl-CoA dehydrogenase family protein [Aerococcus sp. 1KP-2016]|uniref:acyl-CoA dehydrogenase family protein n=1 Tax=Aerococcus sp. 1KP-2016 TaxID=1981982 RepID=UPI000B989F38|nr:acyl-CoA dehydrogenase family protein [Aerococcus sp. 1KP-2016]OYQ67818.1 hypothetical protein B9P78_02285 [Aerococcus sp. 1KP-2016]
MDFKFTDEQELLRKMIQKFAEKEIAPRYEEIEKEGYQQDLTDKMADVGIVGIAVPEAYGGAGYDFVTQTMVIVELAKVNPGVAFTLEAHWKAIDQLVIYGSEEIKARWLPRLIGSYLPLDRLSQLVGLMLLPNKQQLFRLQMVGY